MSLSFLITRHGHLPGVRLSLRGQWGNIPYPDESAAETAARKHANGRPMVIDRKSYPAIGGPRNA